MSNILILKNYTITDHTKWYNDRSNEPNLVENYSAMEEICISSAQKNLLDLDDIIVTRGTEENIRDVFCDHFEEIYEYWHEGNNILYADLDVVFKKPVKVFDQHSVFSMFNYTDPPSTQCSHYNITLPNFFNCGVRYYPQDMDEDIWIRGFQMLANWNPDRWDSEQIIYNAMMWSQDINLEDVYNPEKAYQYLTDNLESNNRFNKIQLEEAKIVHVHGSRSSGNRAQLMEKLSHYV